MDDLAWLVAREQIKELKAKYFRGVDFKDLALLESIFAEDIYVDVRGSATDPVTGVNAVPAATAEALSGREAVLKAFAGGINSMTSVHHGHLPEIEITSDTTAKALWPLFDTLRFPEGPIKELTAYGHYHETYEKIDGTWKIKTLRLTRLRVDAIPA